jgi:hypothetical protein
MGEKEENRGSAFDNAAFFALSFAEISFVRETSTLVPTGGAF